MAEAYNARVSLHNCASSLLTIASLQVWAAAAMAMPLETYPYYSDANDYVHIVKNPPEKSVVDGKISIPSLPGLGTQVNEDVIAPFCCFDFRK